VSYFHDLLWALIGLLLTIGGTFVEGFMVNIPSGFLMENIEPKTLGVSCQIAAVLLIGCLGGKNAAILSQIAYLFLGLTLLPVFSLGGGLGYIFEPSFGYLLGFIPGAGLCGFLAFITKKITLERIFFSCFSGLLVIHIFGIIYLSILSIFKILNPEIMNLNQAIISYSVIPLPGHFSLICAVSVIAFFLRKILLY
jgi:biotin transport system substrate-specific component